MSNKMILISRIMLPVMVILLVLPFSGCDALKTIIGGTDNFTPNQADQTLLQSLPQQFMMLSQAWQIVQKDYVDKSKLDPVKLAQGAVRGMVEAIGDPYTAYVPPDAHKMEMASLTGKYQGIGAYISKKDKLIVIQAPMPGSPAEKAGLKSGDIILKIDGQSTEQLSSTEAALKIQGPAGSVVKLTIGRQGETEPFDVEITRQEIKVASITSEMKGDLSYIKIQQFVDSTNSDFQSTLIDAANKGAKGVILDLRNNPGGLLSQAIDISSQFLLRGMVVKVVDAEGNERPYMVKPGGVAKDIPLIVLVNGGSASASEIVAGALQANGRAKLAGTKTFGKGSVQVIRNMDDGSAIHVTIAKFYTPAGKAINGEGLTPDYVLDDLKDDELVKWAEDYLHKQVSLEPAPATP
ncbi:MAG: S41 family peptidase [Dehalococcoidia bacterium]|nr:S41 family peptidase [Dehalococcoidia bacterium]